MATSAAIVMFGLLVLVGCSSVQKSPSPDQFSTFRPENGSAKTDTPETVWAAMIARLKAGDIEGACAYYSTATKDDYRQAYRSLKKDDLMSVIKDMETIKRASVEEDRAQCYFESTIDGKVITFPVEFVREAGQWKIVEY